MKTKVLTTRSRIDPASPNMAFMFSSVCRVSASMPPGTICCVPRIHTFFAGHKNEPSGLNALGIRPYRRTCLICLDHLDLFLFGSPDVPPFGLTN